MAPASTFQRSAYRICFAFAGPAIVLASIPAGMKVTAAGNTGHRTVLTTLATRVPGAERPGGRRQAFRVARMTGAVVSPADFARPAVRQAADDYSPRQIAQQMLVSDLHWPSWQFRYLDLLWEQESGWNQHACNPGSGAYGIPQALPGAKMASAGPDWRTDARTQIRWGMGYIQARYGTPFQAWQHEQVNGWY